MADGFTRCYHKSLGPRASKRLRAEKTDERIAAAVAPPEGRRCRQRATMMSYRGYGKRDRIRTCG
jgi:hypothetical protein